MVGPVTGGPGEILRRPARRGVGMERGVADQASRKMEKRVNKHMKGRAVGRYIDRWAER